MINGLSQDSAHPEHWPQNHSAEFHVFQQRNPRGLYVKALRSEIRQFTDIDSPYEAPEEPEVH
jgi:adenylylsulfate kinase-like enzyme